MNTSRKVYRFKQRTEIVLKIGDKETLLWLATNIYTSLPLWFGKKKLKIR